MMDTKKLSNTQFWAKFLQSPKRIALIILSIIIVVGGLVLTVAYSTDEPTNLNYSVNLPTAQQGSDSPVAVIEETSIPPIWHAVKLTKNTSLAKLLREHQISTDDIAAIEALPEVKQSSRTLQTGQTVSILQDQQNKLYGLRYTFDSTKILNVTRNDNQFVANIVTKPITSKQIIAHGTITGTLMQSAAQVGIPRKIVLELASIFAWKINFNKDLQLGDTFTVIYDDEYEGNQEISTGDIVAAEVDVNGSVYQAVRFTDADGDEGFYSPQGQSLKNGFLRTPVHYVRVSSPFSLSRMQPILHFRRPHLGVDLATARGTPIEAAGDGTITFVGRDAGYGNLIIIDHGHGITTRYGHIYHFARGIYPGMHVKEGQVIAYVGSTGLATGPHLHYEVRIDGVPYDPSKVNLPGGMPIIKKYRSEFTAESHQLVAEIEH
ncbi:MAG: peptidoglycan DD-metalloendopeptidase family protein, partial [Gammaproteobacteria bacterium]